SLVSRASQESRTMLQQVQPQETEVVAKAKRRTFTAQYKREIVRQAPQGIGAGIGAAGIGGNRCSWESVLVGIGASWESVPWESVPAAIGALLQSVPPCCNRCHPPGLPENCRNHRYCRAAGAIVGQPAGHSRRAVTARASPASAGTLARRSPRSTSHPRRATD